MRCRAIHKHRGVEVAEGQLPQVRLRSGAAVQFGGHGARVYGAELQVRRHPAGGLEIGPVAVLGVPVQPAVDEFRPLRACGLFAGCELEICARVRDLHWSASWPGRSSAPSIRPRRPAAATRAAPGAENGVNTPYGVPSPLVTPPGTPDTANPPPPAARHPARRGRRRRVAGRTVSNPPIRVPRSRQSPWPASEFVAPAGHGSPAACRRGADASRAVRRTVLQPAGSRRRLQPWVQDIAGQHLAVGRSRVQQRRRSCSRRSAGTTTAWACIDAARNSR